MKNDSTILISKTDGFNTRFLDFAKRYDELKNTKVLQTAVIWVETSNYEYIKHFLKNDSCEVIPPFSNKDFASMSNSEITIWHEYCIELQHLLDEKHSLYKELISLF